ncbi:serine hydrolase domain-containing protein [Niallia sp. Krafla_26]|uniref:serine hydrolase domain-containing protein n=1 Tax=Niallia sp. Krafla_26 TaxID=3064703 RepID=UPI003D16BA6E
MRKAILFLVSLLLIPFSTFAKTEDREAIITKFMEKSLDQYQIPGASLAIVEKGENVYHQQWGTLSDGSKVTADTPFLIGSLSKPITSLAIMMLVEEGKIKLDEPIQTYLPSFTYQTDSLKPITVFHLLEQTSGISQFDGLQVTDKEWAIEGAIHQAVEELSGVMLSHEPGEVYEYNSANYLLLGAIIEKVSEQSFADFVNTNIFIPLGMEHSAADYDRAVEKGYVPGFESWFGQPVASGGFYDHAGAPYGYIASSTNDLARFLTFMLEGGDLLSEQNLALLKTPPEEGKTYGLGWHFDKTEHFPYHGGGNSDFRAQMFLLPDENKAAVLLTNKYHIMEDAHVTYIMNGIRSIMSGEETEELPKPSYMIQWSLLVITVLLGILTILHFFRLRRKSRNRKGSFILGTLSLLLAVGLIPLFVKMVGTPWESIVFFAPDIAFLTYCLVGILALNGMMALWMTILKKRAV